MTHRALVIGLSVFGFAAVGAIGDDAAAETTAAFAGRAKYVSQFSCLAPPGGAEPSLTNTCDSSRLLWIPVTVKSAGGTFQVKASVYGSAGARRVNCVAVAYTKDATTHWESGNIATTGALPTQQTLNLGTVFVPASGTLHFACGVEPDGIVHSVEWVAP
ncbi:MAG TPA: hypothetical protein VL242_19200 [Sorangium sp.]|nr:hypothetical protein [Sorangium sp.]